MADANNFNGEVDWDSVPNTNANNTNRRPRVDYVKIPKGGNAKIRFVTKPYKFCRWWRPISAISPGKDEDPLWGQSGYRPNVRYSAYVINRASGNIELYDFSTTILNTIINWAKMKGRKPENVDDGIDWIVSSATVAGEGGRPKTTYSIMNDDTTPLTDEEKAKVQSKLAEAPLSEVRKPDSVEFIQKLYDDYLANPEDPTPGSAKYWQAKKASREAEGSFVKYDQETTAGGHASDLAEPATVAPESTQATVTQASTTDAAPAAEDEAFDNLFGDDGDEDSTSLF